MPGCAKGLCNAAIYAVLVALGGCAKSAPQVPEHTAQANGSAAQSGGSGGTAPAPTGKQDSPATPVAKGGGAGLPAWTASDANSIHLPPTGGADNAGPGQLLTDLSTQGRGTCAGVTAANVVAAMRGAHPELADIPSTREPGVGGDQSFVFSYLRDDGSFALIVKRGDGDCVSGCISKEYWYFDTDEMCKPRQVGHYNDAFNDAGNCYAITGEPMWDVPSKADPAYVCKTGSAQSNMDDAGTIHDTGVGDVCQERWVDFSMQLDQVTASYRTCTSDDDCDIVSDFTGCQGSCGVVVNRQGVDAVANLVASAGAASCDAGGVHCPVLPTPPCIETRAVCVDRTCTDAR
jgi:hypothetical protein